jgi:hypothetical protein
VLDRKLPFDEETMIDDHLPEDDRIPEQPAAERREPALT